jgi:tetratricopeptide (TPR) repeat protein
MPHARAKPRPSSAALSAFERGNAAFDHSDWAGAERAYREALIHQPDYTLARYNYGLLLLTTQRPVEAERELITVLAADPDLASARLNLGTALHLQRRYAEADEQFRLASALGCPLPQLNLNWSVTLTELGQFTRAASLLEPLAARPECRIAALSQLALVRLSQGRMDEAIELHRTLLRLGVRTPEARMNLGVALLTAGRWSEGWEACEARWELEQRPNIPHPPWNGENLAGRRILLVSEQGLGDLIQFVRFAGPLADMGASVLLQCPPEAQELLATHRAIARVVQPPLPDFDYHLPLLSVPRLLGITRDNVPASSPYLRADDAKRAFWRARLPGRGTFRIGLVWRGGGGFPRNHWRSIDLEELAPLFGVPGTTFISLQKGLGLDELARLGANLDLQDLGPIYQAGTLADTAAVIAELDAVISVDTSVIHLTGALARPGWLLLGDPPTDWRWERGVGTSRWYPSLRLFRQPAFGQWKPVVEEVRQALEQTVRGTVR